MDVIYPGNTDKIFVFNENKNIIIDNCALGRSTITELFTGNLNTLTFKNNTYTLSSQLNSSANWYNNKISYLENYTKISKIIDTTIRKIDKSNIVYIQNYNGKNPKTNNYLINHTHAGLYDNISGFITNTISVNDACYNTLSAITNMIPLTFRGVDVGSIIGWPQYKDGNSWLPTIPDGFYNCCYSGDNPGANTNFKIPVDINDPTDKYFNGQLAMLLNGNTTEKTFTIPQLTAITGATDKHRLIYIIKYNNNFEHNQTLYTVFNRSL